MSHLCRIACIQLIISASLIAGCVGNGIVPVSDLTSAINKHIARIVRPGDTLYMIAWESGLDYRQLAEWNNLRLPYKLPIGGRIRLTPPKYWTANSEVKNQLRISSLSDEQIKSATERSVQLESVQVGEGGNSGRINESGLAWSWPAKGKVVSRFTGKNGNNGIDIASGQGSPVRAAAKGRVVYAGSGLRGYGKLLIMQHNDAFFSAYAHNESLLVAEGATVRRGEVIAKMGDTDAASPRLHFEIRRHGKPINPLLYLPK